MVVLMDRVLALTEVIEDSRDHRPPSGYCGRCK
jgi:hypothetical protein